MNSVRAVIDVGTNSVKLLVGQVSGGAVQPLVERSEQTRLGEGFFADRLLRPDAIRRTAGAVARFRAEAEAFAPDRIRILATAAAREALNPSELVAALESAARLPLEIISGGTEADLAFRGVASNPALATLPLLVTDVGGGSTEFIVGHAGHRDFSRSFPLGAVRLFETIRPSSTPSPDQLARCRHEVDRFLAENVRPHLPDLASPPGLPPRAFVGVGGTVVILARMVGGMTDYDRSRIEATRLGTVQLGELVERLWSLSLDERRRLPGLPPERADIILAGVVIYDSILRAFGLDSVRPSTRGLRFAALLDPE